MNKLKKIFSNKFLLAILVFSIWVGFFDPKDIGVIYSKEEKLKDLQQSESILLKNIKDTKDELNQLKSNAGTIEKYAREKYYMKKDNEDVFIVDNQNTVKQ
jgi:cell division protein FtsB